jgi:hypothetical protein
MTKDGMTKGARTTSMNARRAYAELVRHFLSGRMTNHEYEERCSELLKQGDAAVEEVYCHLWFSYCDIQEQRLGCKHGMSRETRREFARWILFLRSGRHYEYEAQGCWPTILAIMTFGLLRSPASAPSGDSEFWPYFRRADYDCDLARPTFLAGNAP